LCMMLSAPPPNEKLAPKFPMSCDDRSSIDLAFSIQRAPAPAKPKLPTNVLPTMDTVEIEVAIAPPVASYALFVMKWLPSTLNEELVPDCIKMAPPFPVGVVLLMNVQLVIVTLPPLRSF